MYFPLLATLALQTPLTLNPLFSDSMVLQREMDDPIYGTAAPGAYVQVELAGQKIGASADSSGHWQVQVRSIRTPGPFEMQVSSGDQHLTVHDVMVGEVWIASGQSNMEFPESAADDYTEAEYATRRDVRMFTVTKATSEKPLTSCEGSWAVAAPGTVGAFSAVGYSFANEICRKLNVPVGIIHTSWGGTPAEAWTSRDALLRIPSLAPMVNTYLADIADYPAKKAAYHEAVKIWINGKSGGENQGFESGWAAVEFSDSDWKPVPSGTMVETVVGKEFDGSFWYRKTVTLPDEWYGKELKLELGALDDYDSTYFDGVKVGATDATTEEAWQVPRVYKIAPGIVRKGSNTIAIRVFNAQGPGGMRGPIDQMKISLADGSASIPLTGNWNFKLEQELDPSAPRPSLPMGPGNPNAPGTLFNGMINPIMPFAIRGAIWYQGESNVGRAKEYSVLFPAMIRDWRARWGEGMFPFYYVQLANYLARKDQPSDSVWAELREAQANTLLQAKTGMATIIDIGAADDIHPKNKKEVGRRLSLIALAKTYHQPVVFESPRFRNFRVSGASVTVEFDNGSLTTIDGAAPKSFAVAGEDRKFYWADARIDGSNVVLSCPQVAKPVAVRYAWADNPAVNSTNRAGLPATPFRTDNWGQ